jgi:GTP1/Obg family GTP-binding protein
MLKKLTREQFSAIKDFTEEVTIRSVRVLKQLHESNTTVTDVLDIIHQVADDYENLLNVCQRLEAEDMQKEYEGRIFNEINKPMGALINDLQKV